MSPHMTADLMPLLLPHMRTLSLSYRITGLVGGGGVITCDCFDLGLLYRVFFIAAVSALQSCIGWLGKWSHLASSNCITQALCT